MDYDSEFDDDSPTLGQFISQDLITKYHVDFNFDKSYLKAIVEEVVVKEKLNFTCIAGGFFTKLNGNTSEPDIYIFPGGNYFPTEEYLNTFLNGEFKQINFRQLGTVSPQGILAIKDVTLKNGTKANVYFTYINFMRSQNHRVQLLNTYDLEPCKVIYFYENNLLECSRWFSEGGNMISEYRNPSMELINKYKNKGFRFYNNNFKTETNFLPNINDISQ
ncbi:unnamed protein product [Brachionus calyciflorus]|uniref:Uncharacterized protein n=1 Tax=Brachionus calyciflorus TaxID=104777 RepID=A0A813M3R6_9BILA|nr:unnamed protein product [Brachionus calyciflorus]